MLGKEKSLSLIVSFSLPLGRPAPFLPFLSSILYSLLFFTKYLIIYSPQNPQKNLAPNPASHLYRCHSHLSYNTLIHPPTPQRSVFP